MSITKYYFQQNIYQTKLFIIILCFCKIIYANTIFEPNKLPNIDYLQNLNQFNKIDFQNYSDNRIFLMYAYNKIRAGKNDNIKCNKLNIKFDLNKFKIFETSIQKYDFNFLQKINLNYIVFCNNLIINNILAAGFANSEVSTLILNLSIDKNYLERVIHHEIFHMIQSAYQINDFNREWIKQNVPNFNYAGCSSCNVIYDTNFINENSGFLTEYSKSSFSEDQAEVFSFWMLNRNIIHSIIENDKILNKKVVILENFLNKIKFKKND